MIRLEHAYWLLGALLAIFAWLGVRDRTNPRRVTSALFWGLLALAFLGGDFFHPAAVGALVIALGLIVGFGGVGAASAAMVLSCPVAFLST